MPHQRQVRFRALSWNSRAGPVCGFASNLRSLSSYSSPRPAICSPPVTVGSKWISRLRVYDRSPGYRRGWWVWREDQERHSQRVRTDMPVLGDWFLTSQPPERANKGSVVFVVLLMALAPAGCRLFGPSDGYTLARANGRDLPVKFDSSGVLDGSISEIHILGGRMELQARHHLRLTYRYRLLRYDATHVILDTTTVMQLTLYYLWTDSSLVLPRTHYSIRDDGRVLVGVDGQVTADFVGEWVRDPQ